YGHGAGVEVSVPGAGAWVWPGIPLRVAHHPMGRACARHVAGRGWVAAAPVISSASRPVKVRTSVGNGEVRRRYSCPTCTALQGSEFRVDMRALTTSHTFPLPSKLKAARHPTSPARSARTESRPPRRPAAHVRSELLTRLPHHRAEVGHPALRDL